MSISKYSSCYPLETYQAYRCDHASALEKLWWWEWYVSLDSCLWYNIHCWVCHQYFLFFFFLSFDSWGKLSLQQTITSVTIWHNSNTPCWSIYLWLYIITPYLKQGLCQLYSCYCCFTTLLPASLNQRTSKKSEKPTGSKPLSPIMPFKLAGADRKGMLFDFSPAIMMVPVVCLMDWGTNAEQPAVMNTIISEGIWSMSSSILNNALLLTDQWSKKYNSLEHGSRRVTNV